jgi:hypothetical protein
VSNLYHFNITFIPSPLRDTTPTVASSHVRQDLCPC